MFSFLSDLLHWFGQGLLTRPSSATAGLPVPDRWRMTWRRPVGRTAGSEDPRRTSRHGCFMIPGKLKQVSSGQRSRHGSFITPMEIETALDSTIRTPQSAQTHPARTRQEPPFSSSCWPRSAVPESAAAESAVPLREQRPLTIGFVLARNNTLGRRDFWLPLPSRERVGERGAGHDQPPCPKGRADWCDPSPYPLPQGERAK